MLIVCPSCATSYMLDPATLGPAGRTVRCARCKATWFAAGQQNAAAAESETRIETAVGAKSEPEVSAFVDGVIAEAETAESHGQPIEQSPRVETDAPKADGSGDDFGDENAGPPPQDEEPAPPADAEPLPAPAAEEPEPPQTIPDAPPLVPPIDHAEMAEATAASAPPDSDDVESFAARRLRLQSRRRKARRSSRWTAVALFLFAFNVALIGARNDIVRYLPQTASLFAAIGLPVNLRHLNFEDVQISRQTIDGNTFLVVKGSIVSTSSTPVEVPRLRFAARNKAGQEIYTWTMKPDHSVLKPGERLTFRSRVISPPKDAHDVMVRFFTASDAMAGDK